MLQICLSGRDEEINQSMDKLQLTGRNLDRVSNFRSSHLHAADFLCFWVKLPNLILKIRPKPLLGYLLLDIVITDQSHPTK